MKIGVIGLGGMGSGMARNLHKAQLLEAVWNRTRQKAIEFANETGVVAATDPATLAGRCEAVLICVSEDRDLFEVVEMLTPGLKARSVVIDCSTVGAETAQVCAERLADHNVAFLDAPVTGGTEGARNGTLSMLVGGDEDALERVTPLLKPVASRITYMGPSGSGQAAKAVNQIMVAGINQAVTEALALAQRLDLPAEKLIDALSGGAAGNWFLHHRGLSMLQGRFDPGFKVSHHHKDLKICQRMAQDAQTPTGIIDMTLPQYAHLIEMGHGAEDISALFRLKNGDEIE
ncbi:NAD(P)-dependent oxidoreductase [Magnetofaba australis]|uniref:Putative 6-phosphogluconate dehydrogenase n=1 Tax=Magnetofaba australis IT-1 TaxID=1434232 RepID=A0A1Y2K5V2_9PROT|nr:NAD(P)-dependent oxidoreductase [Magnetofaba australis]OSM04999.1 putative 6-phosphogluconate dehydrogenase [Magnetofaba australis IT-1]